MRSLRGRLALLTILTTGVGLGLCGTTIFLLVRRELIAAFDDVLIAEARTMAALIEFDDHDQRFTFNGGDLLKARRGELEVTARTIAGATIIQSTAPIPAGQDDAAWTSTSPPRFRRWEHPAGGGWRVVTCSQPITDEESPGANQRVIIALGRPTTALDRRLWRVAGLLAGLTIGACAGMGALLTWGTRRALDPLTELTRRLALLDGRPGATLLPRPDRPTELIPVVDTLNHLLTRIAEAFARERAMGSALAHELRTPLSGLRTVLDVALSRERDAGSYRLALDACQGMTGHLQGLIESLLLLTRLERGQVPVRPVEFDVMVAVKNTWEPLARRRTERGLTVEAHLPPTLGLRSDPDFVAIILRNLLENAVDHADAASSITLAASATADGIRLAISNRCTRLGPDAETQVFARFWRGDQARSGDGHHCGLGLGLAREITQLLGGQLNVTVRSGEFAVFLDLPQQATAVG